MTDGRRRGERYEPVGLKENSASKPLILVRTDVHLTG